MINHYGVWIDPNIPTTGVYSNNRIEFLYDEIYYADSINLDYEEFLDNHNHNEDYCELCEFYESDNDTILIGSWKKDNAGYYIPDESGEYSAIVGECYTQVVWSKHVKAEGALCSPCYPGQVDADSINQGEFLFYALPDDILGTYYD